MQMTVSTLDGDVQKVAFDGALDLAGATEIDVKFSALAGANRNVVVDLEKVGFLASIGIRSLLLNAKVLQRRGGKMVLLNPQPMVEKVLRTSGIDKLIPIHMDLDAALAEIASA